VIHRHPIFLEKEVSYMKVSNEDRFEYLVKVSNEDRLVAPTSIDQTIFGNGKVMFFCPKCSGTNIAMRMVFVLNLDDQMWDRKRIEEKCFDCDDVVQLVKAGIVEPV
jgi:hypothetical protein